MKLHYLPLAFITLALAGCANKPVEPEIRIVEVKVPVPVPCVSDKLAATPAYPDSDETLRKAAGPAERYQIIAAGRLLRIQRLAEVEPVIKACR